MNVQGIAVAELAERAERRFVRLSLV